LAYLNEADMGSYEDALSAPGADIAQTRTYRYKYGFGLNWEQEITKSIGAFSRWGWNDGHSEAWVFTDVNWSGSLGVSVKGEAWRRPDDTLGLAGVVNGISPGNQRFLEAGGMGILAGDGALSYGPEKAVETYYYNFAVWKYFPLTADYQFISDPAFNRARGPVSVLGARIHLEF
jgi:high affinity Mn2+ porin